MEAVRALAIRHRVSAVEEAKGVLELKDNALGGLAVVYGERVFPCLISIARPGLVILSRERLRTSQST